MNHVQNVDDASAAMLIVFALFVFPSQLTFWPFTSLAESRPSPGLIDWRTIQDRSFQKSLSLRVSSSKKGKIVEKECPEMEFLNAFLVKVSGRVVDPDPDPGYGSVLDPGSGSVLDPGSGSVLDPYSIGSLDPDPDPYSESGSGSRRAKLTHKSRKILVKVHVLKCWMASFES